MVGELTLSHLDRSDATCELCHDVVQGGIGTIPHKLEGREDCTVCHKSTPLSG